MVNNQPVENYGSNINEGQPGVLGANVTQNVNSEYPNQTDMNQNTYNMPLDNNDAINNNATVDNTVAMDNNGGLNDPVTNNDFNSINNPVVDTVVSDDSQVVSEPVQTQDISQNIGSDMSANSPVNEMPTSNMDVLNQNPIEANTMNNVVESTDVTSGQSVQSDISNASKINQNIQDTQVDNVTQTLDDNMPDLQEVDPNQNKHTSMWNNNSEQQ